jgi:hypothetical protein
MADFSKDIYEFKQNGTYTYKFDSVGNLIFNSSSADFSQVYVAFPLYDVVFNDKKVDSFYNPEFEEFIPMTSSYTTSSIDANALNRQMALLQTENDQLKVQLDNAIANSETSGSLADQMAIKQVILELRKALGQGRVDSDFSDTFPYTALRKGAK